MKSVFAGVLAFVALLVLSCSGGGESETVADRESGDEQAARADVAPALARADLLTGAWLRPASESGREGLSIESDGRLLLVGHPQTGVDWSLDGDVLVLRTLTKRAPEPVTTRLHVQRLDEQTLSLEGKATDLAGTYTRAELGRVTVTAVSPLPDPLRESERVIARLSAAPEPGQQPSVVIASQGAPGPGKWPITLDIVYDLEAVPAGTPMVVDVMVVSAKGRTVRSSPWLPVAAGDTPSEVSLALEPREGP